MTPIEVRDRIFKEIGVRSVTFSEQTTVLADGESSTHTHMTAFDDEMNMVASGGSYEGMEDAIRRCVANFFARKIEVAA